jgi:DNA recombination protein RmuC
MEIIFLGVLSILVLFPIFLIYIYRPKKEISENKELTELKLKVETLISQLGQFKVDLKDDFKINREENLKQSKENRDELNTTLKNIQKDQKETLEKISSDNVEAFDKLTESLDKELEKLTKKLEEKFSDLIVKAEKNAKENREETKNSFNDFQNGFAAKIKDFNEIQKEKFGQLDKKQKELIEATEEKLVGIKDTLEKKLSDLTNQAKEDSKEQRDNFKNEIKEFQESFTKVQREKFEDLEKKQDLLVEGTEKKLEQMRETVDEKLNKTLNERLGQSFETVGKQLEAVQQGLGEMKNLATDVGGLKKVLSNVKMRGSMGEVQLAMLLEQILAPDQYEANVKTKASSNDLVEFAVKLPGKDDDNAQVWLPIDAKFPQDVYVQLQDAYEEGDTKKIEAAYKTLERTIKLMAKDINQKYLDPPFTTDFGIMFLPFEGIYAEVIRNGSLIETLQREYKIIVTGPTTLAAILNSLQMGFKTLAIQKRSSEVWQVLGGVKKEFEEFGGMLDKAQKNIRTGMNQLDKVRGVRTRAIERKLRDVESLDAIETAKIFPALDNQAETEDKDTLEPKDLQKN